MPQVGRLSSQGGLLISVKLKPGQNRHIHLNFPKLINVFFFFHSITVCDSQNLLIANPRYFDIKYQTIKQAHKARQMRQLNNRIAKYLEILGSLGLQEEQDITARNLNWLNIQPQGLLGSRCCSKQYLRTSTYLEVHRSTSKYLEVPQSTQKYLKIP